MRARDQSTRRETDFLPGKVHSPPPPPSFLRSLVLSFFRRCCGREKRASRTTRDDPREEKGKVSESVSCHPLFTHYCPHVAPVVLRAIFALSTAPSALCLSVSVSPSVCVCLSAWLKNSYVKPAARQQLSQEPLLSQSARMQNDLWYQQVLCGRIPASTCTASMTLQGDSGRDFKSPPQTSKSQTSF